MDGVVRVVPLLAPEVPEPRAVHRRAVVPLLRSAVASAGKGWRMTPAAAELAAALQLRRVGRTKWRGGCPCCGGSNRFQVSEGERGALVYCFAGCTFQAIIGELRACGLWPAADWREFTPEEKRRWVQAKREAEVLTELRADLIVRCRARRNTCWDASSGARRWLYRNPAAPWDEKSLYALRWAGEGERRGDEWEERLRAIETASAAELRELKRGAA